MASVFEVRDEVWEVVEPLLPTVEPRATGRPRVPDRVAFNTIVFVLVTGIAWRFVPRELGCSGVTAWRRLRDWQAAGVWERTMPHCSTSSMQRARSTGQQRSSMAAISALFKGAQTGAVSR